AKRYQLFLQELKQQGIQEERLQLLVNVTGAFRPGVLTTLVGVSGAGKTMLMDVLAGRKTGGVVKHPCKSKAVRNKMAAAGEAIDYKCLILFTNGKKTISTSIQSWFEDRLQDLPDDPNNELMIPEDPECNKEGKTLSDNYDNSVLFRSELSGSVSRLIMDQSSIDYGYRDGEGDAERTLKMVDTGVIGSEIAMAEESGIWSKPNSDNFTQCIELPRNHKSSERRRSLIPIKLLSLKQNMRKLWKVIMLLKQEEKREKEKESMKRADEKYDKKEAAASEDEEF
ncbi:hypothetical protein HN873_071287, partial [Arachis hypogaea]